MTKTAAISARWLLLAALWTSGCASTPGLSSARRGDFEQLREEVVRHDYKPRQVRRLARAVLEAEIAGAENLKDRPFVAGLSTCARPVAGALRRRAESHDGLAAEAALVLVEAHLWGKNTKRYRNVEDGAWRALAARDATRSKDTELRQGYFIDDDQRVRRAALLAALEAKDPRDIGELLEVSRVDPDPLSRNRALQVLGVIGDERVARALQDRFDVADEELRLAIVAAWSQPQLYARGGKEYLKRLLTHSPGLPTVAAANRLARDDNEEIRNVAIARLVRFVQEGARDERRLALQIMPLDSHETTRALIEATEADDQEVAVIAWARLLGHRAEKSRAERQLMAIARSDEETRFEARAALAAGGSQKARALLVGQSRADDATARRIAAMGLIRLGAWEALPPLLADPDAHVRRETACGILARAASQNES